MVFDCDFFICVEDDIVDMSVLLMVVGGKIVWGVGLFVLYDVLILLVMFDWLLVCEYGGYGGWGVM